MFPGYSIPALPFLAAFTIKTASLQSVRNVLAAGQIPFAEQHGDILVYPENACGSGIVFTEG